MTTRAEQTPGRDDSWFATLGLHLHTQPADFDDTPAGTADRPPASPQAAPSPGGQPPGALQRVYRMFTVARALLGMAMVLVQGLVSVSGSTHGSALVLAACAAYAVAALVTVKVSGKARRVLSSRGTLLRRWFSITVGVDLGVFSLLMLLVGPNLNVAALFALPVLMAAALTGRRTALAVAAVAALALLGGASLQVVGGDLTTVFMQAGLAGAGLFAVAALTGELAARLAREERTARSTLALARQQALLNRLVIEQMQDGVLVVDRKAQVRAANPAALTLIGALQQPRGGLFNLQGRDDWAPLVRAVERAYAAGTWPEGGRDIVLRLDPAHPGGAATERTQERALRLRMRFASRRERGAGEPAPANEALCVLFLEDVRTLRARARQEKLAAMGRVSAGIAHEIRNPLAAISQANALLAEELRDAGQQRLARIVADNVERLRRIVDDVMAATPGGAVECAGTIDLAAHIRRLCWEWLHTNQLPSEPHGPLQLQVNEQVLQARFDVEHLRRVLVNLLDNAWRHGSQGPGAVVVQAGLGPPGHVSFSVASDGAPITPDVERHLFEPFFSTRSRGTGLGLYICRELCARHGANIDYRAGSGSGRHHNVFVVSAPTPDPRDTSASTGPFLVR